MSAFQTIRTIERLRALHSSNSLKGQEIKETRRQLRIRRYHKYNHIIDMLTTEMNLLDSILNFIIIESDESDTVVKHDVYDSKMLISKAIKQATALRDRNKVKER